MKKKNIKYLYSFLFIVLVYANIKAQKTGINLTAGASPNTTLDVNGSVAYRGGTAITLVNGANNDITLSDFSLFRITGPTAAFSISGFTGGANGRILTIVNATTQTMTITHQATSSANNQIQTNGSNTTLAANGVAFFIYNSASNKWVLSGGQGFDNIAWNLTGNSGTTAGTNFIGTTDVQDLSFHTNNTEQMRILSGGNIGIGTATPSQKLDVKDGHIALTNSGTASELRFLEPSAGGSNYTSLKAGTQSANLSYTLPVTAPLAGQVLSSDASGNMSWISSPSTISIVKSADESVTNSTTLQADNDFVFTVEANKTYIIEGLIAMGGSSPTAAGVQMGIFAPAGSALNLYLTLTTGGNGVTSNGSAASFGLPAPMNLNSINIRGVLKTGSTAGTATLYWAQSFANATATTITSFSHMSFTKTN